MLGSGKSQGDMLMTIDTPTIHPEAASVASLSPCRQGFDENRRLGYALALAGRYAR